MARIATLRVAVLYSPHNHCAITSHSSMVTSGYSAAWQLLDCLYFREFRIHGTYKGLGRIGCLRTLGPNCIHASLRCLVGRG